MANEWQTAPFGDLVENFDSIRVPVKEADRKPGPYPYYGASGVVDHVDSYIFDGEYLLIAEDGENLKTRQTPIAFLATGKFWVNNHAHIVRANKSNDTRFLMYAMRVADIGSYLTGSTMPKLTQANMNRVPVVAPPLAEQRAIARILGALDDKIELNRKMNATLEEMARALFKSWFVDFDPVRAKAEGRAPSGMDAETAALFPSELVESELGLIPRGWTLECLSGRIEFAIGGQWGANPADEDHTTEVFCIRGTDIPEMSVGHQGAAPKRFLKPSALKSRRLQPGDLVFEVSGGSPTQSTGRVLLITTARVARFSAPLVCSNFCRSIRPRNWSDGLFLYFLLDHMYRRGDFFALENGTTGIKNLPFTTFAETFALLMPPQAAIERFAATAGPLVEGIDANGLESFNLAELRDSLLPKLISGEIDVSKGQLAVQDAR